MGVLYAEALAQHVQHVVEAQTALCKEVLDKVDIKLATRCKVASRRQLPLLTVGDYVLVARVRQMG